MILKINQTLHGYQHGHQLLATSFELSGDAKRNLLFQSDLSGSNIVNGFESYITGYPLTESNIYALSKTWYADEMKRPGCVWTHTLLISFSDLGKISDFNSLVNAFKRPIIDNYASYSDVIEIELTDKVHNQDPYDWTIISALYSKPNSTILIPSKSSDHYLTKILRIWSNQWPRLRRNFMFCSGAISLKTLNEKEFDLQIIPLNNTSIERQSQNFFLLNEDELIFGNWLEMLKHSSRDGIKKFMWAYGADIEGKRKNFIPLVELYYIINKQNIDIVELTEKIHNYFPRKSEAKYLKRRVYGTNSILKISEEKLLEFLITHDEFSFVNINDLSIEDRLVSLLDNNKISEDRFFYLLTSSKYDRVTDDIWSKINFTDFDLVKLVKNNPSLTPLFISNDMEVIYSRGLWSSFDYQTQKDIYYRILKSEKIINWQRLIDIILQSQSKIIFDLYKSHGETVIFQSLERLNIGGEIEAEWADNIIKFNKYFLKWISQNESKISLVLFVRIFNNFTLDQFKQLPISIKTIIKLYRNFENSDYSNKIILAYKILALGLSNYQHGSYLLVEEVFHEVYKSSTMMKIHESVWDLIPKEYHIHEDYDLEDMGFLEIIGSIFGYRKKKKKLNIKPNNRSQILIITLTKKYIKYNWSNQSFLDTLDHREEFFKAVEYCINFKKGTYLLKKLSLDVRHNRVKATSIQKEILLQMYF